MRYLFWNTKKADVKSHLIDIIDEYNPTVIALAEYSAEAQALIAEIKKKLNKDYTEIPQIGCRIKIIISSSIANSVTSCNDSTYYTIKEIPYNDFNETHFVVFLHLPSKKYPTDEKKKYLLSEVLSELYELDCSPKRRAVIMGDFNCNPYENPLTSFFGCNAVSSRIIANKVMKKSKSLNKSVYYFYNPMWNYLGDCSPNYGTYYYSKTTDHSNYWNTFDQFVVSPELVEDIDDICVIRRAKESSLCTKNGIPNVSDHLPLYFKLGGK